MNKIIICYLGPDHLTDLSFETNQETAIINHPETLKYSLQDFVKAFNEEYISDHGLIAIDTEE